MAPPLAAALNDADQPRRYAQRTHDFDWFRQSHGCPRKSGEHVHIDVRIIDMLWLT